MKMERNEKAFMVRKDEKLKAHMKKLFRALIID